MRDVRFAGLTKLTAVRRFGVFERPLNQSDVGRRQVMAEVAGEFRDLRHEIRSSRSGYDVCGGVVLCSISMPILPAASSRSAMTVGLSRSASSSGADPEVICRARLVAASVNSKRLGILARQSSIVIRATGAFLSDSGLRELRDQPRVTNLLAGRRESRGAHYDR